MPSASRDPLKEDFKAFLWALWKFLRLPPPTPVQYDIADYLQYGPKRQAILAFRGVGKSWITSAYVLWCLYCDPQERILVVSATKIRSDDFSTFCMRILLDLKEAIVVVTEDGEELTLNKDEWKSAVVQPAAKNK